MSAKVMPAWASDLVCDRCGKVIDVWEFVEYDDKSMTITHEQGRCSK